MTQLLACPYCNAQMPRPQFAGPVMCPRCQQAFSWRPPNDEPSGQVSGASDFGSGATTNATATNQVGATAQKSPLLFQLTVGSILVAGISLALKLALPGSNTAQRAFPFMELMAGMGLVASLWLWFFIKRRTNGAVAAFVLGNMAVVALMVLPFALATVDRRRANDPKGPPPAPPAAASAVEPVSPALLVGLGYLPDDCNLVAAIHVAELAEQPIGKKLLARQAPGEGQPRPWLIDQGLGSVEKFTGLSADALNHVVLGMHIDAGLPQLTIVVRTRKPYDPAVLAQAQAPAVPVKYRDRDLYQFNVKPVGAGLLFGPDEQTLILVIRLDGLAERDKDTLVLKPRIGVQAPPTLLREMIKERLGSGIQVWWAATQIERPEVLGMLLPLPQNGAEMTKRMIDAKSSVIGLRLTQDAELEGNVECKSAEAGRQLATLLEKQTFDGLGTPKVVGPPVSSNDAWVSFQLRGSPDDVAAAQRPVRLFGRGPGKQERRVKSEE